MTESDRPGVATPTQTVPTGAIQLEGGIEFARASQMSSPASGTLTLPDLLVRVGVAPFLELRVEAEGLEYQFRNGASDRALGSDFSVGAKLRLFEQRGILPQTGVVASLSMPVGSNGATSDGFDPLINGLYQWQLGERTVLLVNTALSAPTQGAADNRRIFQFGPRVAFDLRLTPTIGTFGEYYAEIMTGGVADEHSVDAGITWLVSRRRLQLDLSAGGGLNDAAPDWFVSGGVSVRFEAFGH